MSDSEKEAPPPQESGKQAADNARPEDRSAAAQEGVQEKPARSAGWNSPLALPVAIVIAAIVIGGAIIFTRGNNPTADAEVPAGSASVHIRPPSSSDHIVGSPRAPVVIVEYGDFECPYCAMIYPTIKQIVASSSGQVAWVFRNFPLTSIHPQALPAAEAAECINGELGNKAFWQFVDKDYTEQSEIGPAFYASVAQELGANPTTFANCVAQKTYNNRIDADETEAIANGGLGTPYTVVVGKDGTVIPFSGALPPGQVEAIVDTVLSKQKK